MATGKAPSNPVPAMRTYQPVEHPVVVIGPQYLAQYYVELAVSANDFKVADINGTLIFQGKSKHLSLHDRRFIKDAAGNTLVNLRKKTELDVFLANNKGEVPDFKVKGGYSECSYSVLLGDTNTVIAQMHGKHSPESIILEVYPNVDYAFIITLVIILDEINANRSGGEEDLLNLGVQIITS
ncbi:hypothetical protein OIU77_020518 [Salix suchowensis]|uniref:Protein LURP-one-related 15-like n=1 Tax=Salix suchowensis TaxID=1278906 RepID=A0ABQ9C6T5_9ROSI|nr:hypothetical protein OIU77_020518 [Salix suchowensis]